MTMPANMTPADCVEHVLDAIGGTMGLDLETASIRTALNCLEAADSLDEIRLSLNDMQEAARELLKQISQARRMLQAAGK